MGQRLSACTGTQQPKPAETAAPANPPANTALPTAAPGGSSVMSGSNPPVANMAAAVDKTAFATATAPSSMQPPAEADLAAGNAATQSATKPASPSKAATPSKPRVEVDTSRPSGTSGPLDSSARSMDSSVDTAAAAEGDASFPPLRDELVEPGTPDGMSRDPLSLGATPPPASDDLPEVSLMDIMSSGKTRVTRSRSRRASNTSMASLSAIPENLELTPLTVRADSVRLSLQMLDKSHSKARDALGDVNELDMESKSASMSRHSIRHEASSESSPRSSISSLLNGDDSIMPPDYEYQMLMPVLAQPRAFKRQPNATEAIRSLSLRDGSATASAPLDAAVGAPAGAPAGAAATAPAADGAIAGAAPASASHGSSPLGERAAIATDDSGLRLLESVTQFDDGAPDEELTAEQLRIIPVDEQSEVEYTPVQQGRVQQETIKFELPAAVQGLRCVKKYQVGEIAWSQTTVMGDFDAGVHSYQFEESQVPKGSLSLGKYEMKTIFMDSHGQYLWAAANNFEVVKKVVD